MAAITTGISGDVSISKNDQYTKVSLYVSHSLQNVHNFCSTISPIKDLNIQIIIIILLKCFTVTGKNHALSLFPYVPLILAMTTSHTCLLLLATNLFGVCLSDTSTQHNQCHTKASENEHSPECNVKVDAAYRDFQRSTAPVSDVSTLAPKVILLWTTFFGRADFEFGLGGSEVFAAKGCAVTNCQTTSNKETLPQASAIIFHLRNVDSKTSWPPLRYSNQSYVFFLQV